MPLMEISAPAKINLFLNVLGKRDDGYHNLETILQKIGLSDTIILKEIKSGIRISCLQEEIPTDEENLAYRAASLLLDYTQVKKGVEIEIIKRIPVAAGLGGGSSDAASSLKGLNRLWQLGLSEGVLSRLAAQLGADVPFFLTSGQAALGRGRGDELVELKPLPQMWLVLAVPEIKVSTAWVYKNLETFGLTKADLKGKIILSAIQRGELAGIGGGLFNSLEAVTIAHYPIIAQIKQELVNFGARGALMSGSGPSVFGIFPSQREAEMAINRLSQDKQIRYILTSSS